MDKYCKHCEKKGKPNIPTVWDSFWVYDKDGEPLMHLNVVACEEHCKEAREFFIAAGKGDKETLNKIMNKIENEKNEQISKNQEL